MKLAAIIEFNSVTKLQINIQQTGFHIKKIVYFSRSDFSFLTFLIYINL